MRQFWTVYLGPKNSQLMLSRDEALAAAWFDLHGIVWAPRPVGLSDSNTHWVPGFWLPKMKVAVDVRSIASADVDTQDFMRDRANAIRDQGGQFVIWNGKSGGWRRVIPDTQRFQRELARAFLCGVCENWTYRAECQTCRKDTSWRWMHSGRDYVLDPAKSFHEKKCLPTAEWADTSLKLVLPRDLPEDVKSLRVSDGVFQSAYDTNIALTLFDARKIQVTGCLM